MSKYELMKTNKSRIQAEKYQWKRNKEQTNKKQKEQTKKALIN